MKKTRLALATLALSALFATSAYAASANFSATLPDNQGDTEVSKVARANASNTVQYFTIRISTITTGYTAVRAWAESTAGSNYSTPTQQVPFGKSTQVTYSTTPEKGANVTLNLDNPVATSSSIVAKGSWNPN